MGMGTGELMQEYKNELKRLRAQVDIYREKLIDQVQWNGHMDREEATKCVDRDVFQSLQSQGLLHLV